MRSLGPRARARTRVVRGLEIHEVLVHRGAGPPSTSRFTTAAEAERQAAIYNAELEAGTLDAPADWQGMIDAFMGERARLRPGTLQTYTHRLQAVAAALEGRDPLTLTTADAAAYWHARERDGVSPTTIAAEMDTIAILQRWCVSKGWCRVATWARAPKPEAQRRESHLRPEQIGAFLRRAEELGREPPGHRVAEDYAYWPAAAWLLMHGLRAGEVQHLLVRDVDLVHGIVHVRDRAGARTKTARSDRGVRRRCGGKRARSRLSSQPSKRPRAQSTYLCRFCVDVIKGGGHSPLIGSAERPTRRTTMTDAAIINRSLNALVTAFIAHGFSLADAKNAAMTTLIKDMMDHGVRVDVAFDAVIGEGSYERLAGDLYGALRAA